ncbi:MAG: SUMF1/EgtB/PvdO family nonheme iron enzyme, partial [Anaerolineae bacterium]
MRKRESRDWRLETNPQSPVTNLQFCHIPAGPFSYGPEVCYERLAQCPPFKPEQTIELDEFWLAKIPVTYQQWREFLEETGYDWQGQWWR